MSDSGTEMPSDGRANAVAALDVPLERDIFTRSLIRELAGTLEEVVGLQEASGFISVVGGRIGEQIDRDYRTALGVGQLTREQVADVLVDLKRRIQGDFRIVEATKERIVLETGPAPSRRRSSGVRRCA